MIYVQVEKTAINAVTGRFSYRVIKVRELGTDLDDVFGKQRRAWKTKNKSNCISIILRTAKKIRRGQFINPAKAVQCELF